MPDNNTALLHQINGRLAAIEAVLPLLLAQHPRIDKRVEGKRKDFLRLIKKGQDEHGAHQISAECLAVMNAEGLAFRYPFLEQHVRERLDAISGIVAAMLARAGWGESIREDAHNAYMPHIEDEEKDLQIRVFFGKIMAATDDIINEAEGISG